MVHRDGRHQQADRGPDREEGSPRAGPRRRPPRAPTACARSRTSATSRRRAPQTVSSLAQSRFDWERVLRELSLVIPEDVWLVKVTGTVSPAVDLDAGSADPASQLDPGPRPRDHRVRSRPGRGRGIHRRPRGHRRRDPRRGRVLRLGAMTRATVRPAAEATAGRRLPHQLHLQVRDRRRLRLGADPASRGPGARGPDDGADDQRQRSARRGARDRGTPPQPDGEAQEAANLVPGAGG